MSGSRRRHIHRHLLYRTVGTAVGRGGAENLSVGRVVIHFRGVVARASHFGGEGHTTRDGL